MMCKQTILISFLTAIMAVPTASAQEYHVAGATRERILIDSRYAADAEAVEFLAPYRQRVDSMMSPVVGRSAKYMKSHFPESELSNLLADIMVWGGTLYNERPDVGIYNLGGIRAALPEGTITMGDIVAIAPFDNKICFLTLTGKQLMTLFQQMTSRGAGISTGIEAVYKGMTRSELTLVSLRIKGKKVKPKKKYRIATIDYLIQGNDGFREFRNASDLLIPTDEAANSRFVIAEYFKDKMAKGEVVDSNIEGRIRLIDNEN